MGNCSDCSKAKRCNTLKKIGGKEIARLIGLGGFKCKRYLSVYDASLLRCPFCGGRAKIDEIGRGVVYRVVCKSCKCTSSVECTKEKAVDLWNTRTPQKLNHKEEGI